MQEEQLEKVECPDVKVTNLEKVFFADISKHDFERAAGVLKKIKSSYGDRPRYQYLAMLCKLKATGEDEIYSDEFLYEKVETYVLRNCKNPDKLSKAAVEESIEAFMKDNLMKAIDGSEGEERDFYVAIKDRFISRYFEVYDAYVDSYCDRLVSEAESIDVMKSYNSMRIIKNWYLVNSVCADERGVLKDYKERASKKAKELVLNQSLLCLLMLVPTSLLLVAFVLMLLDFVLLASWFVVFAICAEVIMLILVPCLLGVQLVVFSVLDWLTIMIGSVYNGYIPIIIFAIVSAVVILMGVGMVCVANVDMIKSFAKMVLDIRAQKKRMYL